MQDFITASPYDDVFKTLSQDCKELLIPVINELFGEEYQGDEPIFFSQNEHFEILNNGTTKKVKSDSIFSVIGNETKRYLYECQSTPDSSILIRIFEYISQDARENAVLDGDVLRIKFVNCGILYLRSNGNTPDHMKIELSTPIGDTMEIDVHVMKMVYSLDEIFEKKLWFLLPFYLFTHEKKFAGYEQDKEAERELMREYERIAGCLNELVEKGE